MIYITIIFYIFSALFLLNGIVMNIRTNATVGLFILYGLSLCCFVFGRFHAQILAATNHGILLWIRTLVVIGIAVYLGLMAFIMVQSSTDVTYNEDVVIILGAGVKNGKVSKEQDERLMKLHKLGNYTAVCYGWEEAKNVIDKYIHMPSKEVPLYVQWLKKIKDKFR